MGRIMRDHKMNRRLLPVFLLILCLGCFQKTEPSVSSTPPSKLQALSSMGIKISAYVTLSLDPDKKHDLKLDPETNNFRGEIKVDAGKTFDLTAVYTADDPVTGQTLQIAHYIRKNITTSSEKVTVKYEGDESSWETLFDLSPGQSNVLNLDGDAYSNFVEIGYGSDSTKTESLPEGAKAIGRRKDPIANADVGLPPPGADTTASLKGEEEITIEAATPFDLQEMKIVSPTYGYQILSSDEEIKREKKMRVLVNTARFVVGSKVGEIKFKIKITDEYQIVRETELAFSAYNPTDNLGPLRLQLGLTKDQVLKDKAEFTWEIDDPSGINSTSVVLRNLDSSKGFTITVPTTDLDSGSSRFKANVSLDLTPYPDGSYQWEFSATDSAKNVYSETIATRIANSSPVASFGAVARLLQNGSSVSSVGEDSVVELDGSLSVGPFPDQEKRYSWLCDTPTQFVAQRMRVTLPLPNVARSQGSIPIICTLTFTNGNLRHQADVQFTVTFVNQPPEISTSLSFVQRTVLSPNLPTPSNFKISWNGFDPDGDTITYDLTVTPEGSLTPAITCTGLTVTEIRDGQSGLNCTENRKGYGEKGNPFFLGARSEYTISVIARDVDGGASAADLSAADLTDDGLIGWWRFNGNANDSSGNNLNGLDDSDSSPFLFETGSGVNGSALNLTAGNDYVRVPHNSLLNDPKTIEMRVRFDQLESTGLVDKYSGSGTLGYFLSLAGSNDSIDWSVGGTSLFQMPGIETGDWNHLAVVQGEDSYRLYVNGQLVSYAEQREEIQPNSAIDLFFGANINGMNQYEFLDGAIDEIAFYDEELTVDQVRRNCRRLDTNSSCPDARRPIILAPLPNQELPPTRAYWSWRGEEDRDGGSLYPNFNYSTSSNVDVGNNGTWIGRTQESPNSTGFNVQESLETSSAYELFVTATDSASGSTYESSLTFTTNDSVVGWWSLDGDVTDGSGNGVHGISGAVSAPLFLDSGFCNSDSVVSLLGQSACFNGEDDYIEIAATDIQRLEDLDERSFSILGFARLDGSTGTNRALVHRGDSLSDFSNTYYKVSVNDDDRLQFGYRPYHPTGDREWQNTNTVTLTSNDAVPIDQWFQFAAVRTYGVGVGYDRLFVNGAETGAPSPSTGTSLFWFTERVRPLVIGADMYREMDGTNSTPYASEFMNGSMDEVMILDTGLSSFTICNQYLAFCYSQNENAGMTCETECIPD